MTSSRDEKVWVQYIGPFGRGHHRAFVSDVAEVYYLEIIQVSIETFEKLSTSDWRLVEDVCRHVLMNGKYCPNLRASDSLFCSQCSEYFEERAEFT